MKFSFIKKAGLVAASAVMAFTVSAGDADAKKVRWKMHAAFGSNVAVLGPVGHRIADAVRAMSDGDFDIKVEEPGALAGGYAYYDPISQGSFQAAYGTPGYVATGCGIGHEATCWMTERGMRVCGTDAWSWDAPFVHTAKKVAETGNAGLIWEGHRAGMVKGYCHMEKLANLDQLPATGFQVQCFPVKIKDASAGWCRPVAIL